MTSKTEQFYIRRIAELEKQVAELSELVAKLVLVQRESDKSTSLLRDFSCLRQVGFFRHFGSDG